MRSTPRPSQRAFTGGEVGIGNVLLCGSELLRVLDGPDSQGQFAVERGAFGSPVAPHATGDSAIALARRSIVLPFVKNFFGSAASGAYSYPVRIPNVRIAAAEMFATNGRGNGLTHPVSFTNTVAGGLRTLSGGQLTFQVSGFLAIQANAVPPLTMESDSSVRDVSAKLGQASTGQQVVVRLNRNGAAYCDLIVPPLATKSSATDGAALAALREGDVLTLDVVSVGHDADTLPGTRPHGHRSLIGDSMGEILTKLRPDRDLQCYFERPSAIAALSGASASGFTVSGCWRQQFDWAVVEWNRDNVFEHPVFRNLPDGDLSGLRLSYRERGPTAWPVDSDIFATVDWPSLRVWAEAVIDGVPREVLYKVPLLEQHATPVEGAYQCATAEFELTGTVRAADYVGLAWLGEHHTHFVYYDDTLESIVAAIAASVNGTSATMTAQQSGAKITLTYVGEKGVLPAGQPHGSEREPHRALQPGDRRIDARVGQAVDSHERRNFALRHGAFDLDFSALTDPDQGLVPTTKVQEDCAGPGRRPPAGRLRAQRVRGPHQRVDGIGNRPDLPGRRPGKPQDRGRSRGVAIHRRLDRGCRQLLGWLHPFDGPRP